jgi:hypothetical protein
MSQLTKYDWEIRWRRLKVVSFKSKAWVDLIIGGADTLIEMLDKGYLTGQARLDAERTKQLMGDRNETN